MCVKWGQLGKRGEDGRSSYWTQQKDIKRKTLIFALKHGLDALLINVYHFRLISENTLYF